jgi:hypothetical protein
VALLSSTDFLGLNRLGVDNAETPVQEAGGTVKIGELEDGNNDAGPDRCPDVTGSGLLSNFTFERVS